MKRLLPLAILIMAAMIAGCAAPADERELGPNEVAWKPGTTEILTKGKVSTKEWMINPYLSVPAGQVAVGQKGEVKGAGEYRDIPDVGWSREAAFQTDGTFVGVVRTTKDPSYQILAEPGYYPYRQVDVRVFPIGLLQIRTQTTDAYPSGQTGVEVCLSEKTNYICDGSITTSLKGDDPEISGAFDFDLLVSYDLTQENAQKLWQMGDAKDYLKKVLLNKVRGMRSIGADFTPDEFVHKAEVADTLVDRLTAIFTDAVKGEPVKIVEVRIRWRELTQTAMQLAAAEQAKALQDIQNDKARIEQQKQLDLARIEAQKAVDRANEEAIAARNEFLRAQAKLNSEAGLKYIPCVEQLRDLNLTAEQMTVALIGCMDPTTVETMGQQLTPVWPQQR